jgi:hypothetical protein
MRCNRQFDLHQVISGQEHLIENRLADPLNAYDLHRESNLDQQNIGHFAGRR